MSKSSVKTPEVENTLHATKSRTISEILQDDGSSRVLARSICRSLILLLQASSYPQFRNQPRRSPQVDHYFVRGT